MSRSGSWLIIVMLGVSGMAHAQSQPGAVTEAPTSKTLDEALAYARAHHPVLVAAQARVAARHAEADIPRGLWLPRVGASAQAWAATTNNTTATVIGGADVVLPRIGATRARDLSSANLAPYASTLAAVGVTQEVYDFGRIGAQSDAADAAIEVEKQRGDASWLDVEYGVRQAFYAVLAAHSLVKTAEDAYQRALVHRDVAKAWVDRGMKPRIERERAEADLARFDVGRVRAAGDLQSAQVALAAAVGLDLPSLDATGDPGATPPMPALADALRDAGARAPLIREVLARVQEQEARTRVIDAAELPDLQATGSISGRGGGAPPTTGDPSNLSGGLPLVPNWDVGLILSWPIYDGTVEAARTASRRQEDALKAEVDSARQQEIALVQQAWVQVDVAGRALPALVRAVTAPDANYEQADARFQAGLSNAIELADAEALRTDAEIQLALGRFEVARSRAQFARVVAEELR